MLSFSGYIYYERPDLNQIFKRDFKDLESAISTYKITVFPPAESDTGKRKNIKVVLSEETLKEIKNKS